MGGGTGAKRGYLHVELVDVVDDYILGLHQEVLDLRQEGPLPDALNSHCDGVPGIWSWFKTKRSRKELIWLNAIGWALITATRTPCYICIRDDYQYNYCSQCFYLAPYATPGTPRPPLLPFTCPNGPPIIPPPSSSCPVLLLFRIRVPQPHRTPAHHRSLPKDKLALFCVAGV